MKLCFNKICIRFVEFLLLTFICLFTPGIPALSMRAHAAHGDLDSAFLNQDIMHGFNEKIRAVAVQSDGKIVVGGDFTAYGGVSRNYVARLNSDGSLDTSFAPTNGAEHNVHALAIQSDGKIIIGGEFISYNGVSRKGIARLNSDGSLDTSFTPGTGIGAPNDWVRTIAIDSNGKIMIGGDFTLYNDVARSGIARINTDGTLDTSFAPGTGTGRNVRSIAMQTDGKILIGGYFTAYNGTARSKIARINTDGTLDTSFAPGTGADDVIVTIVVQPDDQILIGGDFTTYNGVDAVRIARINPNGSLDTSFSSAGGPDDIVYSIAKQSDGKIVLGGYFWAYDSQNTANITRLYGYDVVVATPSDPPSVVVGTSNSSSSNSEGASTANTPTSCQNSYPSSRPDLFQIDVSSTTATLFFTPVDLLDQYNISFATWSSAMEHGAQIYLGKEGVQSFTVDYLAPNTTYYFKVSAQNGCVASEWSNTMMITTNSPRSTDTISYYKNQLQSFTSKKLSQINSLVEVPVVAQVSGLTTEAIDPIEAKTPPIKAKKLTCFLWWCW